MTLTTFLLTVSGRRLLKHAALWDHYSSQAKINIIIINNTAVSKHVAASKHVVAIEEGKCVGAGNKRLRHLLHSCQKAK